MLEQPITEGIVICRRDPHLLEKFVEDYVL